MTSKYFEEFFEEKFINLVLSPQKMNMHFEQIKAFDFKP